MKQSTSIGGLYIIFGMITNKYILNTRSLPASLKIHVYTKWITSTSLTKKKNNKYEMGQKNYKQSTQQPRETTWIIKNHTTEAECRIISGETEAYGLTKNVSKLLHPFSFSILYSHN